MGKAMTEIAGSVQAFAQASAERSAQIEGQVAAIQTALERRPPWPLPSASPPPAAMAASAPTADTGRPAPSPLQGTRSMRNATRVLFNSYVSQIALINGVPDASVQFTVAPAVQQTLVERIQQSSEFLSSISMILVPDQEGQKVGIGVTRPISGRTNTANNTRRQPTDPTDTSEMDTYRCEKTDFDWAIPYAKLDAWRTSPSSRRSCATRSSSSRAATPS
jgi:hypothetical protein